MKPTWKKIYRPDGSTEECSNGRKRPEFECIPLPPRDGTIKNIERVLTGLLRYENVTTAAQSHGK